MSNQQDTQKGIKGLILTIGGLAAAVAGIFGLLKVFGVEPPKLVPEPTATSVQMSGVLSNASIEQDVLFGEWRARYNFTTDGWSEEDLQLLGAIVNFSAELTGFKDQTCLVKWQVYNADTNTLVLSSDQGSQLTLTAEREIDRSSQFIWIQYPTENGNYYARVELYDPKGTRLDYLDSPIFPVGVANLQQQDPPVINSPIPEPPQEQLVKRFFVLANEDSCSEINDDDEDTKYTVECEFENVVIYYDEWVNQQALVDYIAYLRTKYTMIHDETWESKAGGYTGSYIVYQRDNGSNVVVFGVDDLPLTAYAICSKDCDAESLLEWMFEYGSKHSTNLQ
jgi:hypothetical protein